MGGECVVVGHFPERDMVVVEEIQSAATLVPHLFEASPVLAGEITLRVFVSEVPLHVGSFAERDAVVPNACLVGSEMNPSFVSSHCRAFR